MNVGLGQWHMAGDRSNASIGGPGAVGNDEVFLAAQEAAQAQRDSQGRLSKAIKKQRHFRADQRTLYFTIEIFFPDLSIIL